MPASLRQMAIRLLARREHTRLELRRKLAAQAESADQLEALLDDLAARRLLADDRYAEQRVNARCGRLGNARLAQELRSSGVEASLIDAALATAGDEVDRARAVWRKKFGAPPADRHEWARQARFLQARGFASDVIARILKDVEDDLDEQHG